MVNLEGHQSWTIFGVQKSPFSTEESSLESTGASVDGSLDHREDNCLPEAQGSLLESEEDSPELAKSFFCANYNTECVETVCFHELEQVSAIPKAASLDTAQLLEAVSMLPGTTHDCLLLPAPAGEGQSVLDLNCEYVKTDFKKLGPLSNGSNVPDSDQRVLDWPHIVKHKQSSITFSEYTCPSRANRCAFVIESSDDGESSQEGEKEDDDGHHDGDDDDEDDDDVFPDLLPHSRDICLSHRQRKDKQKRRASAGTEHRSSSCGYEAEGEASSKEVRDCLR